MKLAATILFVGLGLGYPLVVYFGLRFLEPRVLALILGSALILRLLPGMHSSARRRTLGRSLGFPAALVGIVYLLALVFNEGSFFLYVPTLVSAALLVSFAHSLLRPPSMVESFARMKETALSDEKVEYCRRVTIIWSAFFVLNGSISLLLAVSDSLTAWTLYNTSIAYLMIGLLFAGEYLYRQYRFRRAEGETAGTFFRHLFHSGNDRP